MTLGAILGTFIGAIVGPEVAPYIAPDFIQESMQAGLADQLPLLFKMLGGTGGLLGGSVLSMFFNENILAVQKVNQRAIGEQGDMLRREQNRNDQLWRDH